MAKIKNVSPFGDLHVPALGIDVLAGEVIEVPDEMADSFLEAPFNWVSGDSKKSSPDPVATTETQEEK
jgi:hypothetical protein